jgi:branched-chain amino acid transport system substrate-binding protein
MRFLRAAVLACVLAAAAAGCGSSGSSSSSSTSSSSGAAAGAGSSASSSASATKAPITILSIGDTTGPTKVIGVTHLDGLEAAAAYYNAHGGIDGHKVIVHHFSDNGDSTTAVSVLVQQLDSGTPTMIDAGSEGGDAAALIPVIAKHNVFAVALNDGTHQCLTNSQTACPNEWTLADYSIEDEYPVASWFKAHGIKKVGILEEQIDFTETETPGIEKALKQDGIAYTVANFPATAVDLTPQVQQLKAAGAQGVFTEALVAPAGYALVGRAKLGWKVPMIFDVAASSLDLTKLAPVADVKNKTYEDIFYEMDPKDPSPGIPALLKYSKPFGNITVVPLDVASTGWDEVVALADAVKVAGGATDVNSLDAAMMKIPPTDPLRTFSRKLGFSAADHENVLGAPNDYEIVPAGPVVNGQVHSF